MSKPPYGPNNPPRLRKPGESVEDYRTAMGWPVTPPKANAVVQFNPYTGKPRHPADIASDPEGLLIWDGETPPRAAPAKTGAERQQALLERRKCAGLKQVRNLWCHPDDEPAIREHAAKLARKRAKTVPTK